MTQTYQCTKPLCLQAHAHTHTHTHTYTHIHTHTHTHARTHARTQVSPAQAEEALFAAVEKCVAVNPDLRVVITVSPVRHWREGAVENMRSKAILLVAAQALCERAPQRFSYFPSYEIMMDDLRDYRFYDSDMLHPSGVAVDYIWNKLQEAMLNDACLPVLHRIQAVARAVQHRPFEVPTEPTTLPRLLGIPMPNMNFYAN